MKNAEEMVKLVDAAFITDPEDSLNLARPFLEEGKPYVKEESGMEMMEPEPTEEAGSTESVAPMEVVEPAPEPSPEPEQPSPEEAPQSLLDPFKAFLGSISAALEI